MEYCFHAGNLRPDYHRKNGFLWDGDRIIVPNLQVLPIMTLHLDILVYIKLTILLQGNIGFQGCEIELTTSYELVTTANGTRWSELQYEDY